MRRRAGFILAEIATLMIVGAVALAAALVWGLGGQGINTEFLRAPAEEAFESAFAGREVEIGAMESEWSAEERAVVVTARDMVIRDARGEVQARAERLTAALPALSLLRRQFRPVRIGAEGGAFTIFRGSDGRIQASLGPPSAMAGGGPDGADLAGGAGGAALSGLSEIRLSGASLFILDLPNGLTWRIEDAALDYRRGSGGLTVEASGGLVQRGEHAQLRASARSLPGEDAADLEVEIAGFNGAASGPVRGPLAPLRLIDAPADAAARVRATMDDRLQSVSLAVRVGQGRIMAGGPGGFALRSASLDLVYDAAAQRVTVQTAEVDSARLETTAEGWVEGPDAEGRFAYDLSFDRPRLDFGGAFETPPQAERIALRGDYAPDAREARLDALDVDLGPVSAQLSGRAMLLEAGRSLGALSLSGPVAGDAAPADVLRYWPLGFASGGRDWIADHVEQGRIYDAQVELDLTPEILASGRLPDEALALSFSMDGGVVRYLDGMPPLTGAAGSAVLRGNSFDLTLDEGRIGEIALGAGAVEIPRLSPPGGLARIAGRAEAGLPDLVALLDSEPLALSSRFGVDPASLGGEGALDFTIWRPMRRHVAPTRVGFEIDGLFENVSAPGPLPQFPLTDGRVRIQADPQGLVAAGPARLGPVEAVIEWRETFFQEEEPGTRFGLTAALDREDFDALGVPVRAFLDGPAPVRVSTTGRGLEIESADIEADLTAARLSLGEWTKPRGAPGLARFTFAAGPDGPAIRDIALQAPGLEVRGSAQLGEAGRLVQAELAPVRLDGYADLDAVSAGRDGEALSLSLAGPMLNLQDVVDSLWRGAGAGLGAPVRFDAQIGDLILSPEVSLDEALLSVAHDGEAFRTVSLDAETQGRAVSARIFPSGGEGRVMEAESEDAGLLFQALFGAGQIRGGRLALSGASPAPDAPWAFDAEITDFTVAQAPVLARLLQLASLPGMADLLGGEGISFNRFTASASAADGRITLDQAQGAGPSLGITAEGDIDLGRREVALEGAIAPNLPGNRILGDVLGAREGEGLFALSYTLDGPFSATQIFVNPLSGVAPGFLRRLFEGEPEISEPEPEPEPEPVDPAPAPAE